MPSNTAHGYPYPLPTEPVRDGAVAIKNLADANQARVPIQRGTWQRGGYTTNEFGGINVNVGFTTIGGIAITEQMGYSVVRASNSPAGWIYFQVFGINGAAVPNTFIVLNFMAWG